MEIRCQCPACQARFKVAAKYAGKKARCPKCQQIVAVPAGESAESAAAPQQPAPTAAALPEEPAIKAAEPTEPAPANEDAFGGLQFGGQPKGPAARPPTRNTKPQTPSSSAVASPRKKKDVSPRQMWI